MHLHCHLTREKSWYSKPLGLKPPTLRHTMTWAAFFCQIWLLITSALLVAARAILGWTSNRTINGNAFRLSNIEILEICTKVRYVFSYIISKKESCFSSFHQLFTSPKVGLLAELIKFLEEFLHPFLPFGNVQATWGDYETARFDLFQVVLSRISTSMWQNICLEDLLLNSWNHSNWSIFSLTLFRSCTVGLR